MPTSSNLPQSDAYQFIDYYRLGLDPSELKSVWINQEIIDYILTNASTVSLTGIRVYLAKYVAGVGNVGTVTDPGDFPPNAETLILAVTTDDSDGNHMDLSDGFFNYGNPCPPDCKKGDRGNTV